MIIVPEIRDPWLRISNTNYELVNAVTDYEIDSPDMEEVESVINGDADVIYKGKRFRGEMTLYGLSAATLGVLKGAERTVIRLWPLGMGPITGTNKFYPWVDVILLKVTPFHDNNALYQDAAIIAFASQKYYTLKQENRLGWEGGGVS